MCVMAGPVMYVDLSWGVLWLVLAHLKACSDVCDGWSCQICSLVMTRVLAFRDAFDGYQRAFDCLS